MANRIRGEVVFEVDRGRFTLKYDVNALCELEDALDMGLPEFAQMFADKGKLRIRHVRAAFWAGLRHHRPEITVKDAGDLMMEAGGMTKALDLVGQGLNLAFVGTGSDDESGAEERPQTGRGSKQRGVSGVPPTSTPNNSGASLPAK